MLLRLLIFLFPALPTLYCNLLQVAKHVMRILMNRSRVELNGKRRKTTQDMQIERLRGKNSSMLSRDFDISGGDDVNFIASKSILGSKTFAIRRMSTVMWDIWLEGVKFCGGREKINEILGKWKITKRFYRIYRVMKLEKSLIIDTAASWCTIIVITVCKLRSVSGNALLIGWIMWPVDSCGCLRLNCLY